MLAKLCVGNAYQPARYRELSYRQKTRLWVSAAKLSFLNENGVK
jgi:hypothetical protein